MSLDFEIHIRTVKYVKITSPDLWLPLELDSRYTSHFTSWNYSSTASMCLWRVTLTLWECIFWCQYSQFCCVCTVFTMCSSYCRVPDALDKIKTWSLSSPCFRMSAKTTSKKNFVWAGLSVCSYEALQFPFSQIQRVLGRFMNRDNFLW